MENSFKNKNLLVLVFEVLIIVLGVVGITFATSALINNRAATLVTTSEYDVDFIGDKVITFSDLEPMNDGLVNYSEHENVVRLEFSLRGAKTNDDKDLIYDVMLNEMNIDCSLLSKYTKWNLYKNGELISNGSLDPTWDGSVLTDSMHLTNTQEDLPKYNEDYDNYVLIFWLSESCDDLTTCDLIDQSDMLNSQMSMKVFIALYSGKKQENKRIPNYDNTCANKPKLYDKMIPVVYQDGSWAITDKNNNDKDNLWYDYANSKWANAVILKDNSKSTVGTVLSEDDVLGHFVWIPRFRYKTWNVLDSISDSYHAYDNGIEIVFENGLGKTNNKEIVNNMYLTHPAFSDNVKGFWISKYEISKLDDTYRFVTNTESYVGDTLENYQTIASSIASLYGIDNTQESHMVNNLEWGAVLYLSHSKYGVCKNNSCDKIEVNNSYISGNNKQDVTTRNVYGVYDMAGGASEYVVGNDKIGSATSEVMLSNGDTWYSGHGIISSRDYLIRGGATKELFYFGELSMEQDEIATRISLINKELGN